MDFDVIFQSVYLGKLRIKNRMKFAAATILFGSEEGEVTE